MTPARAEAGKNIKNAAELWYNNTIVNQRGYMKHLLTKVNCKNSDEKQKALVELQNVCSQCRACDLCKTRTSTVFSDGKADAPVMLIGEAPGPEEDIAGKPFVGRAGQLLNTFLSDAGLSRENDIYICNTIKCHTPQNRIPSNAERRACQVYLFGQISIIRPKIILLCGSAALQTFVDDDVKISDIRGKWLNIFDDTEVMAISHPAYLLRQHSTEPNTPRWFMKKDLEKVKTMLQSI